MSLSQKTASLVFKEADEAASRLADALAKRIGVTPIHGHRVPRAAREGHTEAPIIASSTMGSHEEPEPFLEILHPNPKVASWLIAQAEKLAPKYGLHPEWDDDFFDGRYQRVSFSWQGAFGQEAVSASTRLASPQALRHVQTQTSLLLKKIKFARTRSEVALDELKSSDDPAKQEAAKELEQVLPNVLASLDQAEEILRRVGPLSSRINANNYQQVMSHIDQALSEGLMGFNTWGKQTDIQLGNLREKHEKLAKQLSELVRERFKQALRQLREEGLSPDQAGLKASQSPAIQKMMLLSQRTKSKLEAIDLVFHELKSLFETSQPIIEKLKYFYSVLESSLQPRKTAAKFQAQKRLRRVAKRIVLLAYLRSKSL